MKLKILTIPVLIILFSTSKSYSSSYKLRKYLQEAFRTHSVESLSNRKNAFKINKQIFELGRNLFFDKILSGNKNISCATCLAPSMGTGDFLPLSIGEGGRGLGQNRQLHNAKLIPRNAPPLYNRALFGHTTVMWDGRIKREVDGELKTPEPMLNGPTPTLAHITKVLESTLAAQALFPITSHEEMRGIKGSNEIADAKTNQEVWKKLTQRVVAIKGYKNLIEKAYPNTNINQINIGHLANAIGVYEGMAFRATNTAFDRFMNGELYELSDSQVRGAKIFLNEGQCIKCHQGPFLSDFEFHSLGVPHIGPGKEEAHNDRGLELISGNKYDRYKFKTPPLRNVALTGPYMHNGFFTNLKDAIKFHCHPEDYFLTFLNDNTQNHSTLFMKTIDRDYRRNFERLYSLSPSLKNNPQIGEKKLNDLVSFLNSLTDFDSLGQPMGGIPSFVPSNLQIKD